MLKKAYTIIPIFFMAILLIPNTVSSERGLAVISELSRQSGQVGEFKALIIGINKYNDKKIPDLETAVNDAREIARILKHKYGFKVITLFDHKATKKSIYNALRDIAYNAKENDSVLIYYAGHGDLDRQYDDGWWIPSDARGGDPVSYLDNVQVQKAMRSMKARHVLLVSDSCYSGTLFGQQTRSLPPVINSKYYLNLYNEKSRWGMTSGNKTPVADSGTGKHSVFAYELIKVLTFKNEPEPKKNQSAEDVKRYLARREHDYYWMDAVPVVEKLGNIGDTRAVEILIQSLNNREWNVRSKAIEALVKLGDNRAVVPLIEVLDRDGLSSECVTAAWALGEFGDSSAKGALKRASQHRTPHVREAASAALKKFSIIKNKQMPILFQSRFRLYQCTRPFTCFNNYSTHTKRRHQLVPLREVQPIIAVVLLRIPNKRNL